MTKESLIDSNLVLGAADASADIYKNAKETDFVYWRKVEQFRLAGELAAAVRFVDDGRKTAFVAIRGTSLLGNWLFTNFQAYFGSFNVVDESLSAAPSTRYQGGAYRTPVHGALHQGFYRAFSWLWYGTEPILGQPQPNRSIGLARLRRYLTLFVALPALLWLALQSPTMGLMAALAVAFIFVTFESGVWEDIFKDEPEVKGIEPFRLIELLNACDRVVFTGHSLRGSIAAIAFCVYRCWCLSAPDRKDNSVLVTFGAPRVGDVPFMEEFCRLHDGRFCHVVHPGDPVPELPPNGLYELWHRKIWSRGALGFAVLLLFPFWAAIGRLYRANRAARWVTDSQIVIGPSVPNTLKFSHHSMADIYLPWARKRNDAAGDAQRIRLDRA